jgi:hypothetical protein
VRPQLRNPLALLAEPELCSVRRHLHHRASRCWAFAMTTMPVNLSFEDPSESHWLAEGLLELVEPAPPMKVSYDPVRGLVVELEHTPERSSE